MQIDWNQLCSDVQEFLDLDPRFFDQNEGCFPYWHTFCFFKKLPDEFVLTVEGETVHCVRH